MLWYNLKSISFGWREASVVGLLVWCTWSASPEHLQQCLYLRPSNYEPPCNKLSQVTRCHASISL